MKKMASVMSVDSSFCFLLTGVLFALIGFITLEAKATSPYMMICKSDKMELRIQRKLFPGKKGQNGWKYYWAQTDYKVFQGIKPSEGVLTTSISMRNDSRPGYRVFIASLMEDSEAIIRKAGIEGGSEGFGGIDSRKPLLGTFKAEWQLYKSPLDLKFFEIDNHELECQMN
jgi:hypothetical protein